MPHNENNNTNLDLQLLTRILLTLERIEIIGERFMTKFDDVQTLIQAINTATTAVANRIQALLDQINSGASSAQLDQVKSELQAEVDALTAMGQDPNNPVPAPATPAA